MKHATYSEDGGRPSVRFERTYSHPIERVWTAITDPVELRSWFPSSVLIEPRVGGVVTFSDDPYAEDTTGTVLAYEPPARLAFTWGADELYFDLEVLGPGECRLTLVNVLAERDAAARNAAGWTVCVGELDKLLAGTPGDGPHSDSVPPFAPIYDGYIAREFPFGAAVPE
jgi:uncharacterized protein YndB with AHSA1/START domain